MKNKLFFSAMLALLAFGLTLSSCAPSAAKQAIISAASVDEVNGLSDKLTWLQSNAESGGKYVIEIDTDEIVDKKHGEFSEILTGPFSYKGNLSYKGESDITIILRGVGTNRTVSRSYNEGTIFTVGSGVTLVLDNVKIQTGSSIQWGPPVRGALIVVLDGGTLVMNNGSTITGAVYSGNGVPGTGEYVSINSGGGVFIYNGGTLVMNDGSTIIFNTNKYNSGGGVHVSYGGTFIMKGGTITSNICYPTPEPVMMSPNLYKGGGVYVSGGANLLAKTFPSGTFTKTGGTITGYASDPRRGNQVRDLAGKNIAQNNGYAVYAGSKRKETTVGPEVNLHFSDDKFSGDWD